MSGPIRDLIHAWRGLRKQPGFLAAALATLALGIGANITVFSIVNGMLLRPMPFGDRSDRLVTAHATHRLVAEEPDWDDSQVSYRDLVDLRAVSSFESVEGYMARNFVLSGDQASAERVLGGSVTPGLFPQLGITPVLGRQFVAADAQPPGLESVVMITHGLWTRRYGADPSMVGRTIIVNDRARAVVGVLPAGFRFPERDELYMPFRADEAPRSSRVVNAIGLLRPGATIEQAQAEAAATAERLAGLFPESNRGYGVRLLPIRNTYLSADARTMGLVIMVAVLFLLLIVCANLANLLLVKGAARQRELAVRSALGASRARLMWVALSEGLLLAVPGAAIGMLASQWALDAILTTFPEDLPYWLRFDADVRVTAFTIVVALFTAVAVALLPALRAARPDVVNDLKEATRGASLGRAGQRLQAALAGGQVALCFGLLVGASLMVQSFVAMQTTDLGFDHRPVLTARAYLAGDAYDDIRARAAFYQHAASTLAALPGAVAAAATTSIPGDDGGSPRRLVVDGRADEDDEVGVQAIGITPGLFAVLDVPIVEGRTFTGQEAVDPEAAVALINQALASRLWPGESPIDRRVGFRGERGVTWFRVVGAVPDVHYEEVGEDTAESRLNVYLPYSVEGSRSMALLVRADGRPETLLAPARKALQGLSAAFPVYRLMPMSELRRFTTWEQEFLGDLMGSFAAMALLLACLGVYALISYSVGRRSREIGVRLALGAEPADVVTMLLRESAVIGGAGLAAGLALAVMVARVLAGTFYGMRADGWLFLSAAVPLAAALLAATWWPARRASRLSPTLALRDD